jgi:hypothetical protein
LKDERELRKIYKVVLDSWKLYKAHTGTSPIDWAAVVAESDRILGEAGNDKEAFHIVWGFLKALEEEDIHGKGNNGS